MPIVFATPAPVSSFEAGGEAEAIMRNLPTLASAYSHAQELRSREAMANADRMQRSREFADTMRERQQQTVNENNRQFTAIGGELAGIALQADTRAQASAWLNQQELGQADVMRLQREKAAVSHVMADPTLSDEDRADLVLQLRTGIDSKTQRLKQQQIEAETIRKNQLVEQAQAQTALTEQLSQFRAKSLNDRVADVVVDDAGMEEIKKQVNEAYDGAPEEQKAAIIKAEALKNGVMRRMLEHKPGDWQPLTEESSGRSGKAGKEPQQPSEAEVLREARAVVEGRADAPEKDTPEYRKAVADAVKQIKDQAEAKKPQAPQQYKPEEKRQAIEKIEAATVAISLRGDLPVPFRAVVTKALQTTRNLIQRYGHPDAMPPIARKRFDDAERLVSGVPQAPAQKPVATYRAGMATPEGNFRPAAPKLNDQQQWYVKHNLEQLALYKKMGEPLPKNFWETMPPGVAEETVRLADEQGLTRR